MTRRWTRRTPLARAAGTAALAATACALAPAAAQAWTLASPHGTLVVDAGVDHGAVRLVVRRNDSALLGARVRTGRLGPVRVVAGVLDDGFTSPVGARRAHVLHATTLSLRLGGGRRVQLLAADDGIAVRGLHVGAPAWTPARASSPAWLQPFTRSYEQDFGRTALPGAAAGAYGFPALLGTGHGSWALLGESGLGPGQGAAHFRVRASAPSTLAVTRADRDPDPGWSPWRWALAGDLATVVGSDLPQTLGRPSRVPDTSWIHPGRAAWSWWSDGASPANAERQREYVDFAAAQGLEYVVVDAGARPEDVPALAAYAAQRGVRIVLWTDWHPLADPAARAALLDQWASWGVAGIKVDYLESDRRERIALYDAIAADAAARHLVVAFHGCTVPRGIQRTWPNVLTLESARASEHMRGGEPAEAANDVDLAFTRGVLGSLDYGPAAFSSPDRGVTLGHELALAGLYESGLLTYADSPETYASQPAALAVLRALPAAWDDVRLVGGAPDRWVTIARRTAATWWLASVSAEPAATRAAALSFLPPGVPYTATVTADDGFGGLETWTQAVTAQDVLRVGEPALGGFVVRLAPAA